MRFVASLALSTYFRQDFTQVTAPKISRSISARRTAPLRTSSGTLPSPRRAGRAGFVVSGARRARADNAGVPIPEDDFESHWHVTYVTGSRPRSLLPCQRGA